MISVLIPVYQEKVSKLLSSLLEVLEASNQIYEIVISDVSPISQLLEIKDLLNRDRVHYHHHSVIKSRSENRNFLADNAQYDILIFMDCDAVLPDPNFISRYIEKSDGKSVICGGTSYQEGKPSDKTKILRWTYGKNREVRRAIHRQKDPFASFSSFNFCIPASVFHKIRFDESFTEYGHEDTYFGYQIALLEIPLIHIDNPLIHNGLESSTIFIAKTEKSIENLVRMHVSEHTDSDFLKYITLWQTYMTCSKYRITALIKVLFPIIKVVCKANLHSNNPSIRLFDLYKIAYLAKIQG